MLKTFYIYDDTFDAYKNAATHVHRYLRDEYKLLTKWKDYKITNQHPAGYDCICVEVEVPDTLKVKSFLGNTRQCEESTGDKWVCKDILLAELLRDNYYPDVYFDGDRLCGVMQRVKKPKRQREGRL
jgi:hypothetical protein